LARYFDKQNSSRPLVTTALTYGGEPESQQQPPEQPQPEQAAQAEPQPEVAEIWSNPEVINQVSAYVNQVNQNVEAFRTQTVQQLAQTAAVATASHRLREERRRAVDRKTRPPPLIGGILMGWSNLESTTHPLPDNTPC
jgi:hypothetical protein